MSVGPASADEFDQTNSAPTVSAFDASGTHAMQPDDGTSTGMYTVSATISDANTLADLDNVQLCLYWDTASTTCASPDGITQATLTWAQSDNQFTMNDGSGVFWLDAASSSDYVSTATSMDVDFHFTVSEAAHVGGWNVFVKATDDSGATDSSTVDSDASMAYYGAVDVNRASQDYDSLATGGEATALNQSSGTIQANGTSDLFYAAGAFVNTTDGISLANYGTTNGSPTMDPTTGQYALDCQNGATFTEGSAARVLTTATEITPNVFGPGTGEGGSSANVASCRLTNGGGVPAGNYAGTVQVTVASN